MQKLAVNKKKVDQGSLAHRIQEARKKAGMQPEEFRKAIGVSIRTVFNWEGDSTQPKPKQLQKIADATKVNLNWLATGQGEMGGESLETAYRHVGYELRDENGDVAVRVSVLFEVGKTRVQTLAGFVR